MVRKLLAATVTAGLLVQTGCYNTYNISVEQLAKLQEGGRSNAVKVSTDAGEEIVVTENTKVGVTRTDGQYVPISPFNFTLAGGQLVAPDDDQLLSVSEIQTANVKEVSGTKTALLVAAGVAAVVGGFAAIIATAPPKKTGY